MLMFLHKKLNSLHFVFLILLFISFCNLHAANISGEFFIDAVNGNDENTGLSEAEAWKSFNKVNSSVLSEGTRILLKSGCEWNHRLEIKGSGKRENKIIIGSYGNGTSKPKIALTNSKDDIAILITDIDKSSGQVRTQVNNFIEIKDIEIANTRLGIYFRSVKYTENTGFTVRNVTFTNINCDEVMAACNAGTDLAVKNSVISNQLAAAKGNLIDQYGNAGGGKNEYIFPAAIFVGGKTLSNQTITGSHTTVLTEFTVDNCEFNECIAGVMSVFYWPFISTVGDNAWRQIINKIRITNCTGTGAVNGMIALDGVNGGALPDADGVMQPDANGWGVLENVRVTRGSSAPGRTWPNGTTGLIFSNVQGFLINKCEFSGILNQNNPDGCGFDFETNCKNITVQHSRFLNNDGHAMLLMNGGNFGGNKNIVIQKNLFANNLRNSESDFEMYFSRNEDGHQNVRIRNNMAFIPRKNKKNQALNFINTARTYIQDVDNDVYYLDETSQPVTVTFWGEAHTFKAQANNVKMPYVDKLEAVMSDLFSTSTNILLRSTYSKAVPSYYQLSESPNFTNATWKAYTDTIPFTLSTTNGAKTIYLKIKNPIGESNIAYTIVLLKNVPEKLDASTRQHIQVTPNPVVTKAKISVEKKSESSISEPISNLENYSIDIHDYSGKIVYSGYFSGREFLVDFTKFRRGTYIVSVRNVNTDLVSKFSKL